MLCFYFTIDIELYNKINNSKLTKALIIKHSYMHTIKNKSNSTSKVVKMEENLQEELGVHVHNRKL